jgi:hypothetical protein
MDHYSKTGLIAAALASLCLLGGCSSTGELLTKYRLVNSNPWANTAAAREQHRNECLERYNLDTRQQLDAAVPDIQTAFMYCVRNTNGWYLVEAQQYDAEIARINREYYTAASAYN